MKLALKTGALLMLASGAYAQQVADTAFRPPIPRPAFAEGKGPVVLIDEAHHNFHTVDGRYAPFAALLRRDGYRVGGLAEPFSERTLSRARVLVIANALHGSNEEAWARPIRPAFTPSEVAAVRDWVEKGGSLLLIADHMPFAGAAAELGRAFGLEFSDGFAVAPDRSGEPFVFSRGDGTLGNHPIVEGRSPDERVDSIATFTGQGFRAIEGSVVPIFKLSEGMVLLEPDTAWAFNDSTRRRPAKGWLQGAALEFGRGRVVVLGEAAMFSAQLAGPQRVPVGMNSPRARHNAQLLLNTVHWLTSDIEGT